MVRTRVLRKLRYRLMNVNEVNLRTANSFSNGMGVRLQAQTNSPSRSVEHLHHTHLPHRHSAEAASRRGFIPGQTHTIRFTTYSCSWNELPMQITIGQLGRQGVRIQAVRRRCADSWHAAASRRFQRVLAVLPSPLAVLCWPSMARLPLVFSPNNGTPSLFFLPR